MPNVGGIGIDQGGGGGGTSHHSELDELDYVGSGHTGFSPTSHAHAEGDVTNLVTDLAGKKKIFAPADVGTKLIADWNPALGVTYDGSLKVSHFVDQKGSIDFAQATGANQPTINLTYINDKPAIIFSRTGSTYLKATGLGSTLFGYNKPYQIFIVSKQLDSSSGTLFASCDGVGPRMSVGFNGAGYSFFKEIQSGVNREVDWAPLTGIALTATQLIDISKSPGTGQYATVRVDGNTVLENINFNAISTFVAPNLSLGCVNYGTPITYADFISSALIRLIVCTPLTIDETLAMTAYLANEYALSSPSSQAYLPKTPLGAGRLTSYDTPVTDLDYLIEIDAGSRNVTCTLGRLTDMSRFMRYVFTRHDAATSGFYARIQPYGSEKIRFNGVDNSYLDLTARHEALMIQWAGDHWAVIAQTRHTAKSFGALTTASTEVTTLADDDEIGNVDKTDGLWKKITWANFKAMVLAYLRPLYIREKLTSNRTYYVRSDGNDANTGLVDSAAGAFLTIQTAINSYQTLDCNGFNVFIYVGSGTYSTGSIISYRLGSGNLYLIGDTTTPSNVLISVTGGNCINVTGHPSNSMVTIRGFKLSTTTSGMCLVVSNGSNVSYGEIDFGSCAGYHITVNVNAYLGCMANYTISGSALIHCNAQFFGEVYCTGVTVTLTGTPAWTYGFLYCLPISIMKFYPTFVGSATGNKGSCYQNSVIDTNGTSGANLPGNSGPYSGTGGQIS
jgi:hypothetical protein